MTGLVPSTPVIVGVGQLNRDRPGTEEPVDLLAEAALEAAKDAGAPAILDAVDSIRVVRIFTRRYSDPAALVAARLGLSPAESVYSEGGGDIPQVLIDRTAADIESGACDVVLIGGAEAWRSRQAAKRRGKRLDWTVQSDDCQPARMVGAQLDVIHPDDERIGVVTAPQVYPLFEIALRHAAARDPEGHRAMLGRMGEHFARAAQQNPFAAIRRPVTAAEIVTPGPENRMVGYPYTKLMNANNSVDQAAAIIMCSVERARSFGIPSDRWVFLHGAGEGRDHRYIGHRRSLTASDPIRLAGRAALEAAAIDIDAVRYVDLYSCFPSAVQLAAAALGITDNRLTVTGGLTFAGGPWNNYSTHAICALVERLRTDPESYGLVTALGGYATKHAIGVYSGQPPRPGPKVVSVQEQLDALDPVPFVPCHSGSVEIESYTVMHDRDGSPERAHLLCRIERAPRDGLAPRCWGTSTDPGLMQRLLERDLVGRGLVLRDGEVVDCIERGS